MGGGGPHTTIRERYAHVEELTDAGLLRMSEPFWLGYVGTTDFDAAVARWKNSGGSLHRAFEIPNVGRIALVSDAQGAGFAMIQGASDQPSQAFDQNAPGHGNWHELHTTDSKNAFDFYARQFGWTKGPVFDMKSAQV